MNKMRTQSIALALLVSLVFSLAAIATPTFTDQDVDNGYVNPKDQVVVQKIKIVDGSSTINSIWIRNLGDADGSDITKLVIDDDADPFTDPIKSYTALTNLRSGMTLSLGYTVPSGTTYLWIGVEIASAAHDNRNIQFKVQFFSGSYTSPYITDGSAETIFKGGFEKKSDVSPSASYLNPGDADVLVQKATFTDDDGNTAGVGISEVSVSNTEDADDADITDVKVEIVVGATTYTAHKPPLAADWGSGNPLEFAAGEFKAADLTVLPGTFGDNASISVRVRVTAGGTTDKRKIKTLLVLRTNENGVAYDQSILAGKTQTIRIQGFEATRDVSADIPSGVLVPGDKLVQNVTATDDDVNGEKVTINGIWIKNDGDATKDDIKSIVVKKGAITLFTLDGTNIVDFDAGHLYVLTDGFHATDVTDDESVTLSIEYTIHDTITDGHTIQPKVHIWARENAADYASDTVTYPKSIVIHPHGLESVVNVAMADGTAYSGQRLLAQKITCNDLDENSDGVKLNPINVRNIASSRCTDSEVTKVEVRTESGALLGETTSVTGLGAGGIAISTLQNNVVADDGSLTLFVYVTFAGPEAITAGHKLKLETTVFSQEDGHAGENSATGAEWTLAINHRPTCDFDYTPAADLTYQTEITFTAKDVNDEDGDAIKSYTWTFSGGGTGTGTSTKHTFAAGGSVWAKLTVEDTRGLTGSKKNTFDVEAPPVVPVAEFVSDLNTPGVGDQVEFTDTSTTPTGTTITNWSWDFGDDEDSAEQNPKHTYTASGTYTVTLTVTNSNSETDPVTHDIVVSALKPTADFDYSPANPDVGKIVTFTDKSAADAPATINTRAWNFGDGTTSSETDPTHAYDSMGTYTVSLTVTDNNEETSNAHTEQIVVGPPVMMYSYPNPASATANIAYRVPEGATDPVLRIYNITGALVFEQELTAGESPYVWNLTSTSGTDQSNGLYLCIVVAKDNGSTIKSPIFKLLIAK